MTILASIVERFAMELEQPDPDDPWFLDWVLRSPKEAGHHLTAGWHALNAVRDVYPNDEIETCIEFFGGIGAQALMVKEIFKIQRWNHVVGDYSQDAVDHMQGALSEVAEVRRNDAYNGLEIPPTDLILLDFGDLTVWKTREGEKHRHLLDQVFQSAPKAVVLTDIACRYMHLHVDRYESLLYRGACASYPEYLSAFCDRIAELYGYELQAGFYDRWSAVMALVPLETDGKLHPTPSSPVGIELL